MQKVVVDVAEKFDWINSTKAEQEAEVERLSKEKFNEHFEFILKDIGKTYFGLKNPVDHKYVLGTIVTEEGWDLILTPFQNMLFVDVVREGKKIKRYSTDLYGIVRDVVKSEIFE